MSNSLSLLTSTIHWIQFALGFMSECLRTQKTVQLHFPTLHQTDIIVSRSTETTHSLFSLFLQVQSGIFPSPDRVMPIPFSPCHPSQVDFSLSIALFSLHHHLLQTFPLPVLNSSCFFFFSILPLLLASSCSIFSILSIFLIIASLLLPSRSPRGRSIHDCFMVGR